MLHKEPKRSPPRARDLELPELVSEDYLDRHLTRSGEPARPSTFIAQPVSDGSAFSYSARAELAGCRARPVWMLAARRVGFEQVRGRPKLPARRLPLE